MKKKILMLILSICFLIPGAFIFSACGGNGNPPQATELELIVKNDTENPNSFSCAKDLQEGNKEAFTIDDVKVYATYSNNIKKLLDKDDYSYTLMRWVDETNNWTVDSELDFLKSGETTNTKPGMYKIKFSTGNLSQELMVYISKIKRTNIDISLNQYTDANLTEFNKVVLTEGEDCYEVDFLYNYRNSANKYFLSAQDLTPVNSADKLYSDDVWFHVIENKADYFNAENKYEYIVNNQVAYLGSNSFDTYADLLPGEYLVFGFYETTPEYDSGCSENYLKLKINPINIKPISYVRSAASRAIVNDIISDGQLIDDYRDVHIRYQDINIMTSEDGSGAVSTEFSGVVSLNIEEVSSNYLMVSGFNGTEWTHQPIDDTYPQTIKVHAYKDAGKYYLVELKNDKWVKKGTSTEISANLVEFVEYHQVEEYKDSHYITVPIYVSVNSDNLSETSKRIVSGYTNNVVKLDVSIYKEMFSFNDSADESALDIIYDARSADPNYDSLESFINNTLGVTEGYKCLFDINYNKPTGSKPNGEYQVTVDFIDNPNICFAEFEDDTHDDYRTATFLGHSYTWDYKITAVHPNPRYNSNYLIQYLFDEPITVEYIDDLESDNYSISRYIRELCPDYLNIYVYKQQSGEETLSVKEMTQLAMEEGNLVTNDRLISSLDNAIGTYVVVFSLKNNETIKWASDLIADGEPYVDRCIKFQIKKNQAVVVDMLPGYDFEETEFEIDLGQYVELVQGKTLSEENLSVVESCNIDGYFYETSSTCIAEIYDISLFISGAIDQDTICIKISLPADDTYLAFEEYIVITLYDINA